MKQLCDGCDLHEAVFRLGLSHPKPRFVNRENLLPSYILMLLIGSATPIGSMGGSIAYPRLKPWVTSAQPLCGYHPETIQLRSEHPEKYHLQPQSQNRHTI